MSTILFGGSFDPVHCGHISMAQFALQSISATRVLFLPAGQPFGKSDHHVSTEHRVAMLEHALERYPWASLCLYEVQEALQGRYKQHYTIDTLHFLQQYNLIEEHPFLLLGDDRALTFSTWKDYQTLAQLTHILVATRQNQTPPSLNFPHKLLLNAPVSCSSTEIRAAIQQNQPYKHLLPIEVYHYIKKHNLYQPG